MNVSVTVSGLGQTRAALERYRRSVPDRVQAATDRTGQAVAREAKGLAPFDLGDLRASIAYVPGTGGRGAVEATADHAPYVEFGTGDRVDVPSGLESYARQFYVNGEGHTPAQPFLFPAAEAHRDTHLKNVRDAFARP